MIQLFVLREGRNCTVGDTAFCAERGGKMGHVRCSVLC